MKLKISLFIGILGLFSVTSVSADSIRVTLLGTGSPEASFDRYGPSVLVQAGKETMVFDVGRSATVRLAQAKVPLADLRNLTVFLTHLHSDHINGLGDLWSLYYMGPTLRQKPLEIYGPKGIFELTSGLTAAYQPDIDIRSTELHNRNLEFYMDGAKFAPTEVKSEGVVFDKNGVKVSAIRVIHAEKKAFGYRIDYDGKSVVISGDTAFSKNLMAKSKGADLIIHEVMGVSDQMIKNPFVEGVLTAHTRPQEAGQLFAVVKPKLAVYTHLILVDVSEEDLVTLTRRTYDGPLKVGYDLISFVVDKDVTTVK